MQLKCIIEKEIMSICLEERNLVFLLSVCQDPLQRRATSVPTPGRLALVSKRNDIDKIQFRVSFVIRLRALMSIFIKKCLNAFYGRKSQAFF